MASLNKVMLIGRLTADPEPVYTFTNGNSVIKWRFAVGRSRKNKETGQWENDPNPLYIDCEAFSSNGFTRLVDVARDYLRKGKEAYLEGSLELESWDDKATGAKRTKHKLRVTEIQLLDKAGGDNGGSGGQSYSPPPTSRAETHDDIPF